MLCAAGPLQNKPQSLWRPSYMAQFLSTQDLLFSFKESLSQGPHRQFDCNSFLRVNPFVQFKQGLLRTHHIDNQAPLDAKSKRQSHIFQWNLTSCKIKAIALHKALMMMRLICCPLRLLPNDFPANPDKSLLSRIDMKLCRVFYHFWVDVSRVPGSTPCLELDYLEHRATCSPKARL
eukprot:170329-Amphidinium_carterae.1